jgi:hypothetical protein
MVNFILRRHARTNALLKRFASEFSKNMSAGKADAFLTVLLKLMALFFIISPNYRRNINGFEATYVFTDTSGRLYVAAEFRNNRLYVRQRLTETFDFKLTFTDGRALFKLLLSPAPDVLDAVLNQQVDFTGNINYLNKFAYMAVSLQQVALKKE